VPTL